MSRSKYKRLKVIENANRDTFEIMKKDIRYSKDKNNIYFVSKSLYYEYDTYFEQDGIIKMKGADKNSFVIEKNDFSYDKNSVFFMGKKINGINSAGFKIISNLNSDFSFFLIDNKNLYKYTVDFFPDNRTVKRNLEIIKKTKVDVSTFEAVKGYSDVHYRDKNNVYYYDVHNYASDKAEELIKIEGADISTFKPLGNNYSKDKNKVYCKLKEIKGADAPSFTIIWKDTGNGDGFIIKDKNRTYKTNCE